MTTFMGRLGRDPELKYTKNRKPVCNLRVATTNECQETQWRRVVVWDKQAELCSVQLKKGSEIFVHGRSENKSFITSEGTHKDYVEVTARLVGFTNI